MSATAVAMRRQAWQERAEASMAELLVKNDGVSPNLARSVLKHQRSCLVCGNGMLVKWIDGYVPPAERVTVTGTTKHMNKLSVTVHSGCLTEPSFGRRLSDVLGFTEPEV